MVSFSLVAFFAEGDILGDATVSGCPSTSMEKVILTTDTQHMEAISTDWKLVVWRLLAGACRLVHTYI